MRIQQTQLFELYDLFVGQANTDGIPIDSDLIRNAEEYGRIADNLIDYKNQLLDKLPDKLKDKYGQNIELEKMLDIVQELSRYTFFEAYQYGYKAGKECPKPTEHIAKGESL